MKNNCDCINIEVGSFDNQVEISHSNLSYPIMVDKCIAEEIKDLLDKGIKTIGSCCGHNKTIPSIIVVQESVKLMEQLGYIHCFNPNLPVGYGSNLMFFPKSVKHEGFELLEWKRVPRSLFTLSPNEVDNLQALFNAMKIVDKNDLIHLGLVFDTFIDCLLNRIKQWQDENRTDN